jgi:mannose-1-phosphate guanylyltransferase / mannose-6-phosphate isomerase
MEECEKPWGWYRVIEDGESCKVKIIRVDPGARLSLQSHVGRREHWYVIEGRLTVTRGSMGGALEVVELVAGQCIDIEREELHRASNASALPVTFVEVQTGDYFGEDDIVRYEDDYGRG